MSKRQKERALVTSETALHFREFDKSYREARLAKLREGARIAGRDVGRATAYVGYGIFSSFHTVLEVFLAILLLFGMFNASGGYAHLDEGVLTPVQGAIISGGSKLTEVGEAAFNLGYKEVYDGMSSGIGWKVEEVDSADGSILMMTGRYFTMSHFIDWLLEMDTGKGDNIIDKGLSVLFRNVVNLFVNSPDVPDLSDGVDDTEWDEFREKWESLPVVGGWFADLFDWVESLKEDS